MPEKITFGEEKFNQSRVIPLIICLIVITGLAIGGFLMPASQPKLPRLLWFFAAFSAVFALVWFYRPSLSKKKTEIICDSEGCEIRRWTPTRRGGSVFVVKNFKWFEVTEAKVSDQIDYNGDATSSFSLRAGGKNYPLLDTAHEDFRPLLNYVNDATRHLPYEWISRPEAGNRRILEYGEYCKVQRI